ncbi:hypothetical protein EYF80_016746 [Liparis tanakae]|uniref:Uncharacterized protein n=1 Tax=Liparis tanakae TaxID=230148 RepID=A0A4Z2I4T0_9TELE|nr:hypothetical protein EYF80_016746 [Liparis tanakae]
MESRVRAASFIFISASCRVISGTASSRLLSGASLASAEVQASTSASRAAASTAGASLCCDSDSPSGGSGVMSLNASQVSSENEPAAVAATGSESVLVSRRRGRFLGSSSPSREETDDFEDLSDFSSLSSREESDGSSSSSLCSSNDDRSLVWTELTVMSLRPSSSLPLLLCLLLSSRLNLFHLHLLYQPLLPQIHVLLRVLRLHFERLDLCRQLLCILDCMGSSWPLRPLSELALELASWLREVMVSRMDMALLVEVVAGADDEAVQI